MEVLEGTHQPSPGMVEEFIYTGFGDDEVRGQEILWFDQKMHWMFIQKFLQKLKEVQLIDFHIVKPGMVHYPLAVYILKLVTLQHKILKTN